MNNIDFYFDFISPYAYLAHYRLPALAQKYGYGVTYKPIDLKAAKLAAGNTAPPTAAMPAKLRFAMADLTRWAQRYGVPLAWSKAPPVTERANIGTFFALDRGVEQAYVAALWGATFGAGGEFNSDEVLSEVARKLDWSPEEFLEFVQSDEARQRYAAGNQEAQARGVFGVPTMMVGDEIWWGNDRLAFLEGFLAANPASERGFTPSRQRRGEGATGEGIC